MLLTPIHTSNVDTYKCSTQDEDSVGKRAAKGGRSRHWHKGATSIDPTMGDQNEG